MQYLSVNDLADLLVRMAKFKKENKELITYLLFESSNENEYLLGVKRLIDDLFETVNTSSVFFAKKTLRKIIRTANRYIRYSENPASEVEILIYVCKKMKLLDMDWSSSAVIKNMYMGLVKKIHKSMSVLHEELQYDYRQDLLNIESLKP